MINMINEINHYLHSLTEHLKDGQVKEALKYSLEAGGKRLRPMLMLSAIRSYGMDYHPYIPFACAIEFVHTYSLIHDDLPAMDNDDLRRGKPTCHKQFGEATAILAGDALLTEAFRILAFEVDGFDPIKRIQLIQILSEASGQNGMVYGQQQDLYYENKQASLNELKDIHQHKTGCLIQAPLLMASVICNPNDYDSWLNIGKAMGQAFQIQDDILDVIGDSEKLGKNIGSDENSNKSTYVSILGLDQAKIEVENYYRQALHAIYELTINHGLMIGILESLVHRDV